MGRTGWLMLAAFAVACEPPQDEPAIEKPDPAGIVKTVITDGRDFDRDNPFFKSLGSNGRTCNSCHKPDNAWTIGPATVQMIFAASNGLDPLFNPVDGTNSPNADLSTLDARRQASSMLLQKGLIRVGLPVPSDAEFSLVAVDDPYGFASASQLSLFRRPLPATNLRFLTVVMSDGRESTPPHTVGLNALDDHLYRLDLIFDLENQANDATLTHAQAGRSVSERILREIVDFELHLFTAQQTVTGVGPLDALGATGGPVALAHQPFYVSINDVLGADKFGRPFDPNVFTLFDAWENHPNPKLAQIQRGQQLFNTHSFDITGVAGLNDDLNQPTLRGTCTTCHDTPNVGDHSVPLPLDIGISAASRRSADLPLYTLRNKITGEELQTTDPGRALITGKWKDVGKVKGPILRGLAARAPYFHNGSAASFRDVLEFYDDRFAIGFTEQEVADLEAFLTSL